VRHQVFCFSPLVLGTATALDNCFHSRNMRLWRPASSHKDHGAAPVTLMAAFTNEGRLSRYAPANDSPHLNVRPDSTASCGQAALIQLGGNGGVALGSNGLNFANDWQDVSCEPSCRVLDHDIAQDPGFPNLRITNLFDWAKPLGSASLIRLHIKFRRLCGAAIRQFRKMTEACHE
jgi:hypothetical protein